MGKGKLKRKTKMSETKVEVTALEPEEDNGEILSETIFNDKYSILNKLGSGCSADVYLCKLKENQQLYAAKIIHTSTNEYFKGYDVYKEIDLLKKMDHPHIIKFHAAFKTPIDLIVVTEYVEGKNLFDYLERNNAMNEKEGKIVMKCLLSAVAYLHDKNIIHRDIFPGNILTELDACQKVINVKLGDFGFADEGELFFEECGGKTYMAPEMQSLYDNKIDIFSSGMVMFAILSIDYEQFLMLRVCFAQYIPTLENASLNAIDLYRKLSDLNADKRVTAKDALKHEWFNY